MNLRAINSDIIFSFVQDIENGSFSNKTSWGLVIKNPEADIKQPRWAKVLLKGDDVKNEDINVGEYVLVEPLMWTNRIVYENTSLWKTNESKVLATNKTEPENII